MERTHKHAPLASIVAFVAGLAIASTAVAENLSATDELIDPEEIPSVHNSFYKVPEGAVSWDVLGTMDVTVEVTGPLQSVFTKDFTEEVKALDGETVEVMGFLYPLEGGVTHDHFLLTAWPPSCPFCLPAGPAMMVETFAADPVEFSEGAILMAGKLELLENDPSGFLYRMQDAKLVERFDDIRWPGTEAFQSQLQ